MDDAKAQVYRASVSCLPLVRQSDYLDMSKEFDNKESGEYCFVVERGGGKMTVGRFAAVPSEAKNIKIRIMRPPYQHVRLDLKICYLK
jgi:hypothetical protein